MITTAATVVPLMQGLTADHCLHPSISSSVARFWVAARARRAYCIVYISLTLYHFETTLRQICQRPLSKVPGRDGDSLQWCRKGLRFSSPI
jgi:hypothetical protein